MIATFFFLYRGSKNMMDDAPFWMDSGTIHKPHSLSFGLSLFGGILHDKTATVYSHITKKNITDFYAIRCLKTQFLTHTNPESVISETHHIFRTVFFIPPVPTLLELAGMGEFFHGRSKVFLPERDNSQEKFVSGIVHCPFSRLPSFLVVSSENYLFPLLQLIRNATHIQITEKTELYPK